MTHVNPTIRQAVLGILLVSLFGCPLTLAIGVTSVSSEPLVQVTIAFEPSVEPLATEPPPSAILEDELVLPEAFVEGNVLIINGKPYPIGNAFYGGEEIPIGASVTDWTGYYGYAPIEGVENHVLLWYLDGSLRKRYIVTTADDPALIGLAGFDQMIKNLQDAETRMAVAVGAEYSGVLTLVILQALGCVPSAGLGCVTAAATAVAGSIGAAITAGVLLFADLLPAIRNVEAAFSSLDAIRP